VERSATSGFFSGDGEMKTVEAVRDEDTRGANGPAADERRCLRFLSDACHDPLPPAVEGADTAIPDRHA
jgi:hypothetical protein